MGSEEGIGGLYDKICKVENLLSAWTKVKEKGSFGGIDKVTIESFESELDRNIGELSEQLTSYHYIPEPYQEIKIPKDDNEFRSLSLPTIKDKIVQQAVKDLIEPIFDKEFLDVSYAYRANKGPANFECFLGEKDIQKLKDKIEKHLKKGEDIVLYYYLCKDCIEKIERVGLISQEKSVVKII